MRIFLRIFIFWFMGASGVSKWGHTAGVAAPSHGARLRPQPVPAAGGDWRPGLHLDPELQR